MWRRKASQVIKHSKSNDTELVLAVAEIMEELSKAEEKHQCFPYDDAIHMVAIMVEEAGESMQAALDYTYCNASVKDIRKELAQTGAMAIRALIHLPVRGDENE